METTDETLGGLLMLVWYTVVCIGIAICLKKSDRPVWKAFVPVLNAVEVCRMAGLSGWLVMSVFVPIANLFVPFYVGMKLSQRFGASDATGILLGFSGFSLLPVFGLSRWQYQVAVEDHQIASTSLLSDARSPYASSQSLISEKPKDQHQESRTRMIVLSLFYGFGLLCIPGALIVGTMAFGGATQAQVDDAGPVVGLLCLTPVSLLTALIGGWILHSRRRYSAATSLVALPVLNALAAFAGFIWVLA